MIDRIVKAYNELNKELMAEMPFNNPKTRERVAVYLETELQECNIICDETNNTVDIIDACFCIARVSWINNGMVYNYVDLIFGRPEQIELTNDKLEVLHSNNLTIE